MARVPALVTVIPFEGRAQRVKLVFEHRQFKRMSMEERYARRRAGEKIELPQEVAAGFGKRPRFEDFPPGLLIDHPDEWDKIEADGEEVMFIVCPRGTVAIMPKAVTTAKVILWPELVEQGDGKRDQPESGRVIAEGYSVTAWMDNFEKAEGRSHALRHLFQTCTLSGEAKRRLGNCYQTRCATEPQSAISDLRDFLRETDHGTRLTA